MDVVTYHNPVMKQAERRRILPRGMVKNHAPLKNGNYRGVVDAFMKTKGALCLEPGIIRIKLQPQSSPKRTRILQHVYKAVSDMQILYPDSGRVMIFEVAQEVSP